jgi:hypothetical protein
MVCSGYHYTEQPDFAGQPRRAIVFELRLASGGR